MPGVGFHYVKLKTRDATLSIELYDYAPYQGSPQQYSVHFYQLEPKDWSKPRKDRRWDDMQCLQYETEKMSHADALARFQRGVSAMMSAYFHLLDKP